MNVKNSNRKIYSIFLLIFVLPFFLTTQNNNQGTSCNTSPKTIFIPLSQGENLYTQYHKPFYGKDFFEFDVSLTYRFQSASNGGDIAQSIFGYNPLTFVGDPAGSDVNRPAHAFVPEYFGLGYDTNISLTLSPQIQNQIIDMQFYFQIEKVWFQANIPLTKAQWKPTNKIISNDLLVGRSPLQQEAMTYIYNLGATLNVVPKPLPPTGADASSENYNILPVLAGDGALVNNYTGAYIVSNQDISGNSGQVTPLQMDDENEGAIQFSSALYEQGLAGNDQLNAENWKLGIGLLQAPVYTACRYTAPYQAADGATPGIVPSDVSPIYFYDLSDTIVNTTDPVNDETPNVLRINQPQMPSAVSLTDALSGKFNFNTTVQRLYGNLDFGQDINTQIWGVADVQLWLGIDAYCDQYKHLGFYLKAVVPTGTTIDTAWLQYAFAPVIGNGKHFEFGAGLSGHYDVHCRNQTIVSCRVDGYLTHVFGANQFRYFDNLNQPMSRYALVKQLTYTGSAQENALNDNYIFNHLDYLGNVNITQMSVSNDVRAEAIIDLVLRCQCFSGGLGYAFSGLTKDVVSNCFADLNGNTQINLPGKISYGYKGIAPMSTLVVNGIFTNQNENFVPEDAAGAGVSPTNYPLVASYIVDSPAFEGGSNIYVKSSADVTMNGNSGAYFYGTPTSQPVSEDENPENTYTGPEAQDLFLLPNITVENISGLMGAQILNRLFGHLEYSWESLYQPRIGILGSYGFGTGSNKYITANYWDLGFYLGCSF